MSASFNYKNALENTIKKIGQSTISKIVTAKKASGTEYFTKAETEALLKVFQK